MHFLASSSPNLNFANILTQPFWAIPTVYIQMLAQNRHRSHDYCLSSLGNNMYRWEKLNPAIYVYQLSCQSMMLPVPSVLYLICSVWNKEVIILTRESWSEAHQFTRTNKALICFSPEHVVVTAQTEATDFNC